MRTSQKGATATRRVTGSASRRILSTDVEEFVDQLLGRRDHPAVPPILGAGENQVDEVLPDVGVAQFERPAEDGADPVLPWGALYRQARVDPFGVQVLTACLE